MKNIHCRVILSALLLVAATPVAFGQLISFAFADNFTNSSTVNSASPANPTTNATAYETVSSKTWAPNPPILTANDLRFGIASSSSGSFEEEALFATNPVALTEPGDFIQMTITFTNTSGLLVGAGQLGFGLYNSGQVKPFASGLNGTATTGNTGQAVGGVQNWAGYVGQINYNGAASRIMTRPAQTPTANNDQDLITSGSTSSSYTGQTTVGSTVTTPAVTLTTGATYTEVLNITLSDTASLAITNSLYSGPNTSGTLIVTFGGIATNTTYLTGGFDALAFGYRAGATGPTNCMDVSSISVTGSVTQITGPPTILTQPLDVAVPSGQSCAFSVAAQGFNVTYQWHRHGTNLINAGNISGVTSSQLVISPAGPADVLSGANGYYVTVTGAGPFSTNSTTSALSLVTATNLIYSGSGPWDLNTSGSWQDAIGDMGLEFNFGDAVTFDDTGGGGTVTLTGTYLSASSVTVNHTSSFYTFTGSGSFAGPGNLIYTGSGQFNVNNANTFSGGTLINNAGAKLHLGNLNGLGTGPITNATAGAQMEITVAASSTTGIPSDLVILDDFTNIFDPVNSSFGGVYNGNISGTSGKTLIINHSDTDLSNGSDTNITRLRFAGTNTVCNANIFLNDSTFLMASYQTTGTQTYNGVISGSGAFMMKGTITYLNGPNTFTGGATPATGAIGLGIDTAGSPGSLTSGPIGTGPLLLAVDSTTTTSGSGEIFASGGSRIFGNAIQYPSATNNLTLIIGGTNDLTITGAYSLNGNDGLGVGTNRTIQVTNTAATTISTVITDAGLGIGLIKTGPGTLDLNAANTYGGTTTINAGVLAGSGSLNGPVMVNTNGAAIGGGPATSMGTFTVNNSLTFSNGGGGFFRINRAGLASDTVSVSGALTNIGNGIITLNNLGAALQLGDKFTLFNKPVSNGAAMFVLGGNVGWANNLAVDGSVAVAASPDTGIQLAGPASIPPGNITNIITVTNIGPGTALDLVITDAVPANTIFVRADSGGTTNGHAGVVVWNLSNLAINTSTNFTLVFNAAAVETVTNTANVVSAAADPAPANNFATNFIVVASAIIPTVPPHVSSFSLVAGNVIINGTNGVTGGTYYLLGTTNLIKPLVQWTPVATNVVITNGASNNGFTFTGTNVITAGAGQQFYILSSTNNH